MDGLEIVLTNLKYFAKICIWMMLMSSLMTYTLIQIVMLSFKISANIYNFILIIVFPFIITHIILIIMITVLYYILL